MRLSIIVPIYNTANYLIDCIQSVISQSVSYNDYELLLLDDGSTDNSSQICKAYLKRYNNIRYFYKENGGLSDARNFGILKAKGDYLLFLDSDDQLAENALKNIFEHLKGQNVDVLIGRYETKLNKKIYKCPYRLSSDIEKYQGISLLKYILTNTVHYEWYAVLNIVRRAFLLKEHLLFEKNRLFEDSLWTPRVLLKANCVKYIDDPFYIYTIGRNGAITGSCSLKGYMDRIYVCQVQEHLCQYYNFSKLEEKLLLGNLNCLYTSLLVDYWKFPKEDRIKIKSLVKKYIFIYKYSKRYIDTKLYYIGLVNLNCLSYLLFLRNKIKRHFHCCG